MSKPRWVVAGACMLGAWLVYASPIRAQAVWDAPTLMAPGSPSGWGFHLLDPHPGDEVGGLITYRPNAAPTGLGFRAGLAEGASDDLAFMAGIDVSGMLHSEGGDVAIDVIWFLGGGFGLEDDVVFSFPAGLSIGWAFLGDQVSFQPYAGPKVVLDANMSDDVDEELTLDFAIEVGVDLAFGDDWMIRGAASFVDRDAVSIGIHIPG